MRYIGLDVHKDNITACVLSDAGKVVFEKDFKKTDGTCDCLAELFDHVGKKGFCVLMETGTYAYPPYRFFVMITSSSADPMIRQTCCRVSFIKHSA